MPEDDGRGGRSERQELDRRLTSDMAAAQRGDRRAYAQLLRDCVPVVRRVARGQGASADFIDDIVQDVLITLHGARQTFDPSRSFIAWITVIAQRRTIDFLRKRGRRGAHEIHAPVEFERHAALDDPLRDIERQDEADRLRTAVATLPDGQRQAVQVLALEENSLEEASRATGRTKTALKVNFHRAIRALRQRLDEEGKP